MKLMWFQAILILFLVLCVISNLAKYKLIFVHIPEEKFQGNKLFQFFCQLLKNLKDVKSFIFHSHLNIPLVLLINEYTMCCCLNTRTKKMCYKKVELHLLMFSIFI